MTFESIMNSYNRQRKELFAKMVNKVIDEATFTEECKKIEIKVEETYHIFLSEAKIIVSAEEIDIDYGFLKNTN